MNSLNEGDMGCLMVGIPPEEGFALREWAKSVISKEDLAGDGFEAFPHVTVLYGFDPKVKAKEVKKFCRSVVDKVDIELVDVTRFKAKDKSGTDVLKIDVVSKDLQELHKALKSEFKVELTHPKYTPHLTLAYVKPGSLKELDGHGYFRGNLYRLTDAVYSSPGGHPKLNFSLKSDLDECLGARLVRSLSSQ